MKTSIRSKLFLFAYGTVLFLIVGIIVLNNTFLERYYLRSRQRSLVEAFTEIKEVDVADSEFQSVIFEIEEDHSINIHIVLENIPQDPEAPLIYQWIYGGQRPHDDHLFEAIINEYKLQEAGLSENQVEPIRIDDPDYRGYMMQIESPQDQSSSDQASTFSFCVATTALDQATYYYILMITIASVKENIAIFNTFTIIVGFVFMIVSGLAMYFISYNFTNPILQMTNIAKNIANLDFKDKVAIKADDELGDLGLSINQMSQQLETSIEELKAANVKLSKDLQLKDKVDAMRKEFIASASHELKTPLALVMGYCEALKLPGLDKATAEDYLSIIMDESNRMNKLVMSMLEISQLESGIMNIQNRQFHIRDLIEETIKMFSIMFDEKQIEVLTTIEDVEVNVDYDHIQTVLSNFIANAIHHVDEHKKIKISANVESDKSLKVAVYNSGMQIPDVEKERIWESFYKLDKARTRSYGGQGLGLSISKTILENLGLKYGVINHIDGVEFFFSIRV
ncbi:MAG: HAMP domain-containing sensor histidine kinase [Candidatus Izemoplasmatales bacterium]|nr:HAMP domain-containing sensor histidine kinase [Candidatus Izemoplasmatales bacterium]